MQRRVGGASRVWLMIGVAAAAGCTISSSDGGRDTTAADTGRARAVGAVGAIAVPDSALAGAQWTQSAGGEPEATVADSTAAPDGSPNAAPDAAPNAAPAAAPDAARGTDMRIEVDVDARKLYVYHGSARTETFGVAVGSAKWPTQRGQWQIKQVIFNPAWIPPDESWADENEPKAPGAPDNPLGRAQLVYDPPRTVHGTNQPASIGKAVSHGSIRMTNATIVQLAREVLDAAGAAKDDAWYRRASENRREKQVVDLPVTVPIRVY